MSEYDPDDLRTHYLAWRRALKIARDFSSGQMDSSERAYWDHEIKVFDRTMIALTGGPDGDPILEVKTTVQPAKEAKAHPDGPGGWWRQSNPWDEHAIYVPVEDLAHALGYDGVPARWLSYSSRLDAYVLPGRQGQGYLSAGIRYGPECDQYLSPGTYDKPRQDRLHELVAQVTAETDMPSP